MATIEAGFDQPVDATQAIFRTVMQALARPGRIERLTADLTPPAPLTPEMAALALTLADQDAPLWLDAPLAASEAVVGYLRFHTGAPIMADPAEAAFALVTDASALPDLASFAQGSDAFPDRSTTVVVAVDALAASGGFRLRGPGIQGEARLHVPALPDDFARQAAANRTRFPRGVDLVFVADGQMAALPRSTTIVGDT
ncbi:phosphonate C-P lyase system protein PhnH [Marinivivus vitaminiproducens]|uniref:phosphonate C-P lyase system protein PhnH n=1 Tax=Marinivivus vitaminiproducens TaxID=3035935 RepID=UPI0027A861D4|nr:phosphonate C-P lyase system protein PhnH [Geminicoccaceae bacterium SCSIO 64248]